MLGPRRCRTTKLQEYFQRLHAEPNQIFEGFYLIRLNENCIAKSRPFWEHQGKNAKYQEHIEDRLHMLNKMSRSSSIFLTRLSKQEETKASDPIAAPKISIPSTQFLLIKLSILVMLSIDPSSHLSFLSSKPNVSSDSERISNASQSSISVPAIIPSSRYQQCCKRCGILLSILSIRGQMANENKRGPIGSPCCTPV